MQWMWLTTAAIIGIVAGYLAGWRVAVVAMRPTLQELHQNLATDRNLALSVLRRELANWMFRHDPDRYLQTYKTAHEATKVISKIDNREQCRELAILTERHKFYKDFDSIATRDYVLYADALSGNTYDEVEHHYIDIIRFQALQIALNHWGNWDIMPPTNDAELAHLEKYLQRFKDARFENRVKAAIREFRVYQASTPREPAMIYESPLFTVRRVSHFAEVRYGVHFKDTDEYGLYTVLHDDSYDKTYEFVFRSDDTFQKESVLDALSVAPGDA
jgi:hypothetical protein